MSSHKIPSNMLVHLEYLRNLHLQGPRIGNSYLEDTALRSYLENHPISQNKPFQKELERLGDRFTNQYLEAARNAQQNHPRLQQFDSYGKRIDKLHLSEGWKQLGKYSSQDGIVAMAYEDDKFKLKEHQRFGQLVTLYMYHTSSGLYGCPLAMTDGAAYTLRNIDKTSSPHLQTAFNHLTSRTDPWTSGQWMTQKKGGSDVSNTQTVAIKNSQGTYNLYGYKWFTSATESQMSLALGKVISGNQVPSPQNLSKIKVSLFFIKTREGDRLNNLEIIRLKDKLGTQQLPTAELLLKGTQGFLVGEEGQGVKMISKMLTVTRLYNSATAVGVMRRMLALCRDYSSRRAIGKTTLSSMPLQLRVLSHLQVTHRANLIFYLNVAQLFSKQHAKVITSHQSNLLRVFTPILKLFTGKQVMQVATECLQCFGGMGYIEGTMLPTLMRDAQVLSIWEGTTNVLCYDVVRALGKKQNQLAPLQSIIRFFLQSFDKFTRTDLADPQFVHSNKLLIESYLALISDIEKGLGKQFKGSFGELRTYCFGLAKVYIAALLQLQATMTLNQVDIQIAARWIKRGLYSPEKYSSKLDQKLAMDLNELGNARGVGDKDARNQIRPRF